MVLTKVSAYSDWCFKVCGLWNRVVVGEEEEGKEVQEEEEGG